MRVKHLRHYSLFESEQNEHEDVVLYHGSKSKFDEFDDEMVSKGEGGDLFGKGFYLTNNEDVAKFYAHQTAKKDHIVKWNNQGIFGTELPEYSDDADERAAEKAVVNRFRLRGRVLNAKEYLVDEGLAARIRELVVEHSGWPAKEGAQIADRALNHVRNNSHKIHKYRGELEYLIHHVGYLDKRVVEGMMDYIREQGYDAIKYESDKSYEGEGSWNYVVFNKRALSPA